MTEPFEIIVKQSLDNLLTPELSLETFNSQYLQQNTSPPNVLAVAEVLHKLKAPPEEIEGPIFGLLDPQSSLDLKASFTITIKVYYINPICMSQNALKILRFMQDIGLPRSDEFRSACNQRFELSTIFKSTDELEKLRKEVHDIINSTETSEEKEKPVLSP